MSVAYKPVGWNRTKLIYDAYLVAGIGAYLVVFLKLGPLLGRSAGLIDLPILRMRAFGSCAFILLTLILAIGPLARLDSRFLPLLYNRRHFGVATAIVALSHAGFVLDWYFAYSPVPKLTALFTANTSFGHVVGFPFELFGLVALVILAVMAVTSHDFWLNFLTPPLWKTIHMAVYVAYAAVVLHVGLGALQDTRNPLLAALVGASVVMIAGLHTLAGRRERAIDARPAPQPEPGWILAGDVGEIAEGRALIAVAAGGERIAVFRSKGRLSALSNVCSHQNGPLGEGRVVLGFVTCPWHGYQYRLEDGCSPPPFKERVRKYALKLDGSRILIDPTPLPLGTRVEPVAIPPDLAAIGVAALAPTKATAGERKP